MSEVMTSDNELLSVVRNALATTDLDHYINIPIPDSDDLIVLLRYVLENNVFEFNKKYYKLELLFLVEQIGQRVP